ncbi:MAG: 3-methyl-2-oxobutanoate hydroxymethyltransferase [Desulfotignum sp.]|nr:3-methyl-2-oxobutanoate hydroxymethyltransferase [Desulfotignum sp.]MCF8139175.1 3-methyl-2-oxobutanoate hydroxymethyltransferase [Desulfotignum sp.]
MARSSHDLSLFVEDALAVEAAGAKMLLVEGVPPEVTNYIWKKLEIPVMSIGAGPHCDGQLLIVSDLIGQFQAFTPKFVKKYCNVAEVITNAMKKYVSEVKETIFPDEDKYCYHMVEGEEDKFIALMEK